MIKTALKWMCVCLLVTHGYAQALLDTSKLALFGNEGATLSKSQIRKADSILINAVNYYNAHIERKYELVSLTEAEYNAFKKTDSLRNSYLPFLSESGEIKKKKLSKLSEAGRKNVLSLIATKASIDSAFQAYIQKGKANRNDPVVSFWGSTDTIDITKYCRQYSFTIYKDGSVFLHATCFCDHIQKQLTQTKINWKHTPVKIHDAGACAFTIYLDLKEGIARMMHVNGI